MCVYYAWPSVWHPAEGLQPGAAKRTHSINYSYYHYYYFLCDGHSPTARTPQNDSLPEAIYV